MHSEMAQIVLKVHPLTNADRGRVKDLLESMESVRSAEVDVRNGVVRVDGAASDVELLQARSRPGTSLLAHAASGAAWSAGLAVAGC